MVVNLVLLVVAVGLSLLAGYLLQKKQKNLTKDDKPTTIATRGAYCPFVLGLRRIGPIFTWAGDRRSAKEKVEGGKGGAFGGSPKQDVYYERGWHWLCVGPARALRRIYQQGKVIFEGPITPFSHPSGSRIDLGKEGVFEIYWGEETQPTNTDLGVSTRVGITSRWPFMFYVFWDEKRLGPSPAWPLLDYEIEVNTPDSAAIVTRTDAYFPPTFTLDGETVAIFDRVNGAQYTGANPTTAGQFIVSGDKTQVFKSLSRLRLTGNALPDQDLDVLAPLTFIVEITPPVPPSSSFPFGIPGVYVTRTRVFIQGGLSGASAAGNIQAYSAAADDGYNPAHLIAQLLFGQYPLGYSLDTADFDLESLEQLGELAVVEDLRCSLIGLEGENVDAILGSLLQDLGVMLPINPFNGLLTFTPVRAPVGTLPTINENLLLDPAPEVETYLGEKLVDRMVLIFQDRENNYRDMSIGIDDDGNASFYEYQRARQVQITGTVNFKTASSIAERRSQEELAGGAAIKIYAARAARSLMPGAAFICEGFEEVLRLTDVETDPLSGKVTLLAMPDFYGAPLSDFQNIPGNTGEPLKAVAPDLAVAIVEIPSYQNATGQVALLVLRARAHEQISGTDLHFSPDNSSYTFIAAVVGSEAAGTLDAALDVTDSAYLATGPTITVLGPDDDLEALNTITPLSDTDWRLGRLVAQIEQETFFVKDITLIAPGQWRLDGLLRARFDTKKASHAMGATMFLFRSDNVSGIQDVLLQPGAQLFVKSAPKASSGQVSLGAVSPANTYILGKGVVPERPWALHATAPDPYVRVYHAGGDISLKWGYRSTASAKTGAGQQRAGTSLVASAVEGFFRLTFTAGVTSFTVDVTGGATTYTLLNATIVSEFGSEPATITVTVDNRDGSGVSPVETITITKT